MVTLENMTEEQKNKRNYFYDFYFPDAVIMFSEFLNEQREAVKKMEFYQYYENIIEKSARLLREIGATDPLTASATIQYLLWNGYFSKDKSLVYSESKRVNNFVATGADVVRGRSVCLNNADFEATILRRLGKEAFIIGARVNPKQKIEFEYRPNIVRNVDEKVSLWQKLFIKLVEFTPLRRIGNHAVTLIKTDGQYVISDPTALAYANITDFMKATYVGSTGSMDLKPWLMLLLDGVDIEKFKEIVETSFANSDREVLNARLVKQVYDNGIYLCQKNKTLIDDFHEEIEPDIEEVSRTLAKVKM